MLTGKEDHTGNATEVPISIACIVIEGEAGVPTVGGVCEAGVPTAGGVGGGLDIQRLQSCHRREEREEADGNRQEENLEAHDSGSVHPQ